MIKLELGNGRYLSDNPPQLQAGLNIISCPTGKGKTTWFTSLSCQKVLVLPTNSLVSQQHEILSSKGFNVGQCDQNNNSYHLENDVILTTPESSYKVSSMIAESGEINRWVLGVDEWHNMALSQGYRENGYTKALLNAIGLKWGCVIGLTGTPIQSCSPLVENANFVQVSTNTRIQPYSIMRYESGNNGDMSALSHVVKSGESIGIFCNSTGKGLEKIKALLAVLGVGPDSVFEFNSKTKDEEIAEYIYKKESLPENVKIIIFTSVFAEGCNLKGHFDKLVFMPDYVDLPPQSYQQIANRFRDSAPYVYILSNTRKCGGNVEYQQFLDVHTSNMSHLYQQWNNATSVQKFAIMRQYNNFESSYIRLCDNGEYHKNYFYADYKAIMDYAIHCRHNDIDQLIQHLSLYNWQFDKVIEVGDYAGLDATSRQFVKDTVSIISSESKIKRDEILDSLSRGVIDPSIALQLRNIAKLIHNVKPAMMPALSEEMAARLYSAYGGNVESVKPILKAMANVKSDSFTNSIVNSFEVGELLTVAEIKDRVISVYKSDSSFRAIATELYPKAFSKREMSITDKRVMILIRLFFNIDRKRKKINGKQVYKYHIVSAVTLENLCE